MPFELNSQCHQTLTEQHLIDVESGEIIEFQNEELEEMKRQVALKMGYELVDHRLELFGKKIKK